jgi:hypothetical protein
VVVVWRFRSPESHQPNARHCNPTVTECMSMWSLIASCFGPPCAGVLIPALPYVLPTVISNLFHATVVNCMEQSQTSNQEPPVSMTATLERPQCNKCAVSRCTIDPASVDLYYFPNNKNVSRDMCASNPVRGWATRFPDYPNSSKIFPIRGTINEFTESKKHTCLSLLVLTRP